MATATMEKKYKSGKSRRETAVQGTNDSSIVSKCSMAAVGYFDDQFLKEFVSKTSRRSPLINRGYYIRATAIDYILKKFLSSSSEKKQILSLGAGFDSAYFRHKSGGFLDNVVFCEIDFPDLVKRKHSVISTTSTLNELIPGYTVDAKKADPLIEINTASYKLLGVDLTQHNTLEALLKLCGIDFELPTLLLSECVLTYMTKRCSSNVVKWAAETFCNSTFVLYEQINPNDAFGLFMQNHFKTIGSALKCINAFPTMASQLQRFKTLGWERVEAMDMNQFYTNLVSSEERNRVEWLEPFDEYEEWHLKCAHYMVLCAYNGTSNNILTDISRQGNHDASACQTIPSWITMATVDDVSIVQRIGHASTVVDNIIVSLAGFGKECNKHQRLSSVTVTDIKTFKSKVLQLDADLQKIEVGRLRHTLTTLKDGSIILIGGRISPVYSCTQIIKLNLTVANMKIEKGLNTDSETIGHKICDLNNVIPKLNCDDKDSKKSNNDSNCEKGNSNCELYPSNFEKENENDENISVRPSNSGQSISNNRTLENRLESRRSNSKLNNSNIVSSNKNCLPNQTNSEFKKCELNSDLTTQNLNMENSNCNVDSSNESNKHIGSIHRKEEILNSITSDKNSKVCDNSYNVTTADEESMSVLWSVFDQTGELPVSRWRHSAVVFEKNGKEMIFIYGGRNEKQLALNCGYFLDPESGQWIKMCSTGSEPGYRLSHTASIWKNNIILAGGLNLDLIPQNSIHMLDIDTVTWREFELTGNLLPRYAHTAEVLGDSLVLIGGVNLSHCPPGVALIDLLSGSCREYSLPDPDPSSLIMLHQHQLCYLGDGRFVIIGGGGNCFSFGTHLNKSPCILDIRKCLCESVNSVSA